MSKKFVYLFNETDETMRNLVGGKGANLGQMTKLGLPIPQGFTVTTEACTQFYQDGAKISKEIEKEIFKNVKELEKISGKKFGNPDNPLLVSVRSGARVSMPGMMDTILNLGLNDEVVEGLAKATGNPQFAYDSYRRFIQMYSDVVLGFDKSKFERLIDKMKRERGIELDNEFSAEDLKLMVKKFKNIYFENTNKEFPVDPKEQLLGAVSAVFNSWENPRAEYYRRMNGIPSEWGTAVNVQEMVYGNMGPTSGTGVAFSRNPATGDNHVFGEYLMNAQGEDVVAGTRTPQHLDTLADVLPKVHKQFIDTMRFLENHYKDMQDVEFTIENEKLYILQTRSGKRTAHAALKIAVDMVHEGLITKEDAVMMVGTEHLDNLLHPTFDQDELKHLKPIGSGLPASPGAATGVVAFSVDQVLDFHRKGIPSILVRVETSPEDIEGMHLSEGFLTARGGMTSHAAVVARGMGKTCVASAHNIFINEEMGFFELGGKRLKKGDWIALDGTIGNVYGEKIKTVPVKISGDFEEFMGWVDEFRKLGVRTNADTPQDARQALAFGAEGIGLVRTEHMFFEGTRIKAMREMILARTGAQRRIALDKLLPIQQKDFEELIVAMEGHPITVRYLDPPLHEFLPTSMADVRELAEELKLNPEEVNAIVTSLHEFNPMMGHRGVRLSISHPEIAEMQTTALINAYIKVQKAHPEWKLVPEIMIPLIGDVKELQYVKAVVVETADRLIAQSGIKLDYLVGTMMEIPRACFLADEVAKEADFFSFGTNDLTQMTYGFSRDDAAGFLKDYQDKRIFEFDPFQTIDQNGVGRLVKMAVEKGRKGNKNLHIGICGEHGGDPRSVEFFHNVGLDYVSCSPFRVPIAKLAAAKAAIKEKRAKK